MPTIAFDMGGVLLTDGSQSAWTKLEAEYGISAEKAAKLWYGDLQRPADRGEMDEDEIWTALKSLGTEASETEIRTTFLSEYVPIEQGVAALRTAVSAGWQVLLATNNVSAWVEYWKEKYDWMRLPVATICSSDLGVRKPDPAFYEELARATTSWPAWFVDDKPENLAPAQQFGYVPVRAVAIGRWALPSFKEKADDLL
jgi:putative hydrolase of the HAD superfamily